MWFRRSAATKTSAVVEKHDEQSTFRGAPRRGPDKTAVVSGDARRSFSDLDLRTSRLSEAMRRMGVSAGDRVVLKLPNCTEHIESTLAIWKLEAFVVPLKANMRIDHVSSAIRDSGAVLMVTEACFWSEFVAALENPSGCRAILVGDRGASTAPNLSSGVCEEYEAAVASGDPGAGPSNPETGAYIALYQAPETDGVSGKIRVSSLVASDLAVSQEGQSQFWGLGIDDVYLLAGPVYHPGPGGWLQAALHVGATSVVMKTWDPITWLETVQQHRVTHCFMTPRQFKDLSAVSDADWKKYDTTSLKTIAHGGAPCPVAVKMRIIERLAPAEVWEIYGMIDMAVSRISSAEWIERPGSVGRPLPDVAVEIVNSDGRQLTAGQRGAIRWSRVNKWRPGQPVRFASQRAEPAAQPEGSQVFGSTHVGYLDEDGYLFITDRLVDVVRKGTTSIYPWEVEEVIHGHRGVVDCVVFGVRSSRAEVRLVALVEVNRGVSSDDLSAHCRLYLPESRCPDEFVVTDRFERDEIGKVSRRAMSDAYSSRTSYFAQADGRTTGGDGAETIRGTRPA